jgi:Na+/glutamate symporter
MTQTGAGTLHHGPATLHRTMGQRLCIYSIVSEVLILIKNIVVLVCIYLLAIIDNHLGIVLSHAVLYGGRQ